MIYYAIPSQWVFNKVLDRRGRPRYVFMDWAERNLGYVPDISPNLYMYFRTEDDLILFKLGFID